MEISFKNALIEKAVAELRRLVGGSQASIIPSASMLFFSMEAGEGLTIKGTDLQTEQTYRFPNILCDSQGSALVSARKFFDICRLFEGDKEISLLLDEDKSKISVGGAQYELLSLPTDEFPEFSREEEGFTININLSELHHIVSKTLISMPQNDARYYLNGLFLEVKDGFLVAVSTDGHRLSLAKTPIKEKPGEEPPKAILPAKLVSYLPEILSDREGEVELTICPSQVHFKLDGMEITTKVLEGTYPNYAKILPKNLPKKIRVDRNEFRRNLMRVVAISNGESSFGANFVFDEGLLKIRAENNDKEKVQIEQALQDNKENLEVAFNVHYLNAIFSVVGSSEVLCEFKDGQSTAQFREDTSESTLYIVMPLRI